MEYISKAMISESIPSYIRDYLLGAKPPKNCCVPEGSLPALVEGDLRQAIVATIGINPHGGLSRDKYPPLDEGGAEMVWNDKQQYFRKRRYSYFGRLERVLNKCGISYGGKYDLEGHYSDRLACSLDLVQWPTSPLWSMIPKKSQAELLKDGRPFVELVLEKNPRIGLLLGNGHTVVRNVEQLFSTQLERCGEIEGFRLYIGEVQGVRFIGWNYFLSRRGVTIPQMEALGARIAEIGGERVPSLVNENVASSTTPEN